ncbi:MAG: carotenoid 1,2-hydratase [Rhizobiales bacterium]|nr:carotenoid 1,2-hydratase [Hyphomicrobiales bacterium]
METGKSGSLSERLAFTAEIARNGYAWWYVDGISDDGAFGLTIIGFIGSVFSPYYALARRRGRGEPANFVALNVALYGAGHNRWCMTERGRSALTRERTRLTIGPSMLRSEGDDLVITIDETTVPWPRRLKGEVRVTPAALTTRTFDLDDEGRHRWSPIAPRCRLQVAMDRPSIHWRGNGYLDRNQGERPLEDDFSCWDWSRAQVNDDTVILYDITRRDGGQHAIGLRVDRQGRCLDIEPPPRSPLPPTIWRVPRSTQCGCKAHLPGCARRLPWNEGRGAHGTRTPCSARIVDTLEDTPFYSRSIIETHLLGQLTIAMHESLSLDRFRQRWVHLLLPFRMPRRR